MGCDANSQHMVWDNSDTNNRFEKLLFSTDMDIRKTRNIPTFRNASLQSDFD